MWSRGRKDVDGNFARGKVHVNGTTTITTENGSSIDRWTITDTFDPEDGTLTTTGNPLNVHVPGLGTGVLVNDSGRLSIDTDTGEVLFIGGPHPAFLGPKAFDEACALAEG